MLIIQIFFFFFFQAEDGIRDLTVTGVQTCALPIWGDARGRAFPAAQQRCDEQDTCRLHRSLLLSSSATPPEARGVAPGSGAAPLVPSNLRNQARAGSGRPWCTAARARASSSTGSIGAYLRFG